METLEPIQLERTALLVVGMQNDFCHPQGVWVKQKGSDQRQIEQTVATLLPLVAAARSSGLPILHLALVTTPWTTWPSQKEPSPSSLCWEGSWGAQFYGLEPQPQDRIITRYRPSGFFETDLDLALQAKERTTVLLTGFNGDGGVLLTGADATARNYLAFFVSDGIAGWSDAQERESLLKFTERQIGAILPSQQVMSRLSPEGG